MDRSGFKAFGKELLEELDVVADSDVINGVKSSTHQGEEKSAEPVPVSVPVPVGPAVIHGYLGYLMVHAPGDGGSAIQAGHSQVVSMDYTERPITNAATCIMVPEETLKNFIKMYNTVSGMQISLSPGNPCYEISRDQLKYMMQLVGNYYQTEQLDLASWGPCPSVIWFTAFGR